MAAVYFSFFIVKSYQGKHDFFDNFSFSAMFRLVAHKSDIPFREPKIPKE